MATSTTTLPVPSRATEAAVSSLSARRSISPQAGRALEVLGHAIEYLTDEYVHQGGSLCAQSGQLEAVQLLMAANRAVYFACPRVPTLGARLRRWLGLAQRAA
jgi:hypothetical protein